VTYSIEILRSAQKQLARIDRQNQDRIIAAIGLQKNRALTAARSSAFVLLGEYESGSIASSMRLLMNVSSFS
jgi:mRNA-degrading endonuclease RelE of RelBE toxin-antitoxin system